MNRTELMSIIKEINPSISRQIETLLKCGCRFCKITMKRDEIKDNLFRSGRPRVFIVNCRATYDHMMKRHFDSDYRFDPTIQTSTMKARKTCTERAILGVVETVNESGVSRLQYRNVDLKKIQSIQCGNIIENFS